MFVFTKKDGTRQEKERIIESDVRMEIGERRGTYVSHSKKYGRSSEYVSKSGTEWKDQSVIGRFTTNVQRTT